MRGLGWTSIGTEDDDGIEIGSANQSVSMLIELVTEMKVINNRLHLDVRPNGIDHAKEFECLVAFGARPVDMGQGEVAWHVLADPEGNESCLLRGRCERPAVTVPSRHL